jgi:hypothetical protein
MSEVTRGPTLCNFVSGSADSQLRIQALMQDGKVISYVAIATKYKASEKTEVEVNLSIEQAYEFGIS